jgi:hypothetical protein
MNSAQNGYHGERLIDILTTFMNNVILADLIPTELRPVFCGASLTALAKKDDGIRPTALGFTLRHLVAKVAIRRVSSQAAAILRPDQLGVGVQLGIEAAAHAAQCFISNSLSGDRALLKLRLH